MFRPTLFPVAAAVACLASALPARAGTITDPAGDFIPSFTDERTPDRDVLSLAAARGNGAFTFSSTFAGLAGSAPGTIYVFGIDRGQGTARFGSLAPGVLFDSVVVVTPGAATVVRDLLANTAATLGPNATLLSGDTLQVVVPESTLPTAGFTFDQYTVNLWPRSGAGSNSQISDFAPDNSNLGVVVPEPASIALLGLAFAGLAALRRNA